MAVTGGAANVVIKLQMTGVPQARAGFKAVEKQAVDSGNKVTREAEKSAKAREKIERNNARAVLALRKTITKGMREEDARATSNAKRENDKRARDFAKSEREKLAAAKRTASDEARIDRQLANGRRQAAREQNRMNERNSRAQRQRMVANERALRQERTRTERQLAGLGAVTGVGIGAGIDAAERAQGTLGIRSQESVTSDAIGLQQRFLAQSSQAGASPGVARAMFERAIGVAQARNVSPTQVVEALIQGQEQFSTMAEAIEGGTAGIDHLFSTLDNFALMARATTDDVSSVSGAMNAFSRQFHLDTAQTHEAMGILFQGSKEGSLGMADFAQTMPEVLAPFITARGSSVTGLQGLREFAAVAQGIRASGQSPERTRVLTGALFQNLSDVNVQERLAASHEDGGLGIRATDAMGNIRSPADLIREIASRRDIDTTSTAFRSIFHGMEATQAITGLVNQERAGVTLAGRVGVDAAAGNFEMARVARDLDNSASGRAVAMATDREATALRQADQMIAVNIDLASRMTALQNEFPRLALAFEMLKPVMTAIVGVLGAKALLPGSFFSTLTGTAAPAVGGALGANAATGASLGAGATATRVGAMGALFPFALMGTAAYGAYQQHESMQEGSAQRRGEQQFWQDMGNPFGIGIGGGYGMHGATGKRRKGGASAGSSLRGGFLPPGEMMPRAPSAPFSAVPPQAAGPTPPGGWQGAQTPRQAAAPIVDATQAQTRALSSVLSAGFLQVATAVAARPATGSTSAVTPPRAAPIGPFR